MNMDLLNSYKDIEVPEKCLYRKEPNAKELFREFDSPLAFLDLDECKQTVLYEWCNSIEKVQNINKHHTSYGLKHIFARTKKDFYVYNGAFKGAMVAAGFKVADETELNWHFNISEKSVKDILKKQRKYALH
ncbi:hypothetical protein [Carnobacterium sp.]|uniref:hypothetical protein n=1 Tax=Carnobacterium sp. TaxID=48221 RepID=UPI00264A0436|nr:hypothetical protein [Carnobacterium sp.]